MIKKCFNSPQHDLSCALYTYTHTSQYKMSLSRQMLPRVVVIHEPDVAVGVGDVADDLPGGGGGGVEAAPGRLQQGEQLPGASVGEHPRGPKEEGGNGEGEPP